MAQETVAGENNEDAASFFRRLRCPLQRMIKAAPGHPLALTCVLAKWQSRGKILRKRRKINILRWPGVYATRKAGWQSGKLGCAKRPCQEAPCRNGRGPLRLDSLQDQNTTVGLPN